MASTLARATLKNKKISYNSSPHLRIRLHLLKDHSHGRISHDLLHLGVVHRIPSHLVRWEINLNPGEIKKEF